jgi:translation initiation factor 2 subunit 1
MNTMTEKKLPKPNEVVIGTVKSIVPTGAYVILDEYNGIEAYIHISEVSSTWVHNIRDYIKEKQKAIFKVIDVKDGNIFLSLRRVTSTERKEKMTQWKRNQKGKKLVEIVAQRTGKNFQEIYPTISRLFIENYGDLLSGFEKAANEQAENELEKIGIPRQLIPTIISVARDNIKLPEVHVYGILQLSSNRPNGVNVIKEALINAEKEAKKYSNVKVNIFTLGAPKYRLDVKAQSYKEAEEALSRIVNTTINIIKKSGGTGLFIRIKQSK